MKTCALIAWLAVAPPAAAQASFSTDSFGTTRGQ